MRLMTVDDNPRYVYPIARFSDTRYRVKYQASGITAWACLWTFIRWTAAETPRRRPGPGCSSPCGM